MLLTGCSPRPLFTHLGRGKSKPTYDPSLQSPIDVGFHSPGLGANSRSYPPIPIPTQQAGIHDSYRPFCPSPLRTVDNAPGQAPAKLGHQTTIANFRAPGSKPTGFPGPHTHQQNLLIPKRVRFHGKDVVIPPPHDSPATPTISTENIANETQQSSNPCWGSPPSPLAISYETTLSTSSDHLMHHPDRETPALDEFPDGPSVFSPTPPNSSVSPTSDYLEKGSPWLTQADRAVIGTRSHSVGRFTGESPSDEQSNEGRPYRNDGSMSI